MRMRRRRSGGVKGPFSEKNEKGATQQNLAILASLPAKSWARLQTKKKATSKLMILKRWREFAWVPLAIAARIGSAPE